MSLFESIKDLLATASSTLIVVSSLFSPSQQLLSQPVTPSAQIVNSYAVSGEYTYLGQKITYTVFFPQKGGSITGKVDGICQGDVGGDYKRSESAISGVILGNCKLGFFSQDAKIIFSGSVNEGEKKTYLNWVGDGFLAGKRGNVALDLTTN